MCGASINWCAFSWEAFATLVTGIAAVFAAFCIGWRQASILKRQTDIQHLAVREALFNRRYSVYERTSRYLVQVLQSAQLADPQIQQEFFSAMIESRFLFGGNISSRLLAIRGNVDDYLLHEMQEQHHLAANFRNRIKEDLESLADLFAEMKLELSRT